MVNLSEAYRRLMRGCRNLDRGLGLFIKRKLSLFPAFTSTAHIRCNIRTWVVKPFKSFLSQCEGRFQVKAVEILASFYNLFGPNKSGHSNTFLRS